MEVWVALSFAVSLIALLVAWMAYVEAGAARRLALDAQSAHRYVAAVSTPITAPVEKRATPQRTRVGPTPTYRNGRSRLR